MSKFTEICEEVLKTEKELNAMGGTLLAGRRISIIVRAAKIMEDALIDQRRRGHAHAERVLQEVEKICQE